MEENKVMEGINENVVSEISKGNVFTKVAIGGVILTGVAFAVVKGVKRLKSKKANKEVIESVNVDDNKKSAK